MFVVKSLDRVARALRRLEPNECATFAETVPVPDDVDVDQRTKRGEHGPVILFVRRLGRHADEELFYLLVRVALAVLLFEGESRPSRLESWEPLPSLHFRRRQQQSG